MPWVMDASLSLSLSLILSLSLFPRSNRWWMGHRPIDGWAIDKERERERERERETSGLERWQWMAGEGGGGKEITVVNRLGPRNHLTQVGREIKSILDWSWATLFNNRKRNCFSRLCSGLWAMFDWQASRGIDGSHQATHRGWMDALFSHRKWKRKRLWSQESRDKEMHHWVMADGRIDAWCKRAGEKENNNAKPFSRAERVTDKANFGLIWHETYKLKA